jgi:hypothetical protein
MVRIQHFVDNRLTDGSDVSLKGHAHVQALPRSYLCKPVCIGKPVHVEAGLYLAQTPKCGPCKLCSVEDVTLAACGQAFMCQCLISPGIFLVLSSVRGRVNSRGIVHLEGLGNLKKFIDLIGNLTINLPACGIVPQPTMLPHMIGKQ